GRTQSERTSAACLPPGNTSLLASFSPYGPSATLLACLARPPPPIACHPCDRSIATLSLPTSHERIAGTAQAAINPLSNDVKLYYVDVRRCSIANIVGQVGVGQAGAGRRRKWRTQSTGTDRRDKRSREA